MENNKKIKIGMGICIAVMIIGVLALVFYTFNLGDKLSSFLNSESIEEITEISSQTEPEFVPASGPQGGINAVWLENITDFSDEQSAVAAMYDIGKRGFNTVIFSSCSNETLTGLSAHARSQKLYSVAFVKPSQLLTSGLADGYKAAALLSCGIDSVMLDSTGCSEHEIEEAARAVYLVAPNYYLGIYDVTEQTYSPVCKQGLFSYKYVDIFTPTSKINGDYINYLSSYIDSTTTDTVFGIRLELIGISAGYESPEEIISQYDSVTMTASFGCGFYRYNFLKENRDGISDALSDFMSSGKKHDFFKELVISKPESQKVKTDESKISFVGTADVYNEVLMNGNLVELTEDGYFAFEIDLHPGENVFTFSHKGKTQVYKVTYDMELIRSVQPKGKVNAPGEANLDIAVVAHKSAEVSAQFNGTTFELVRSDEFADESGADIGSDYTYFIGSYLLPPETESVQDLGSVKVTATYDGIEKTVTGASVSVNAAIIPTEPVTEELSSVEIVSTTLSVEESNSFVDSSSDSQPTTVSQTTSVHSTDTEIFKLLTPYNNNGVAGKSKMIVVKENYAEAFPNSTTNDVSVPYYTHLLEGTVDYVTGTLSYEEFDYYVLKSGRRVYKDAVDYLPSGFNMPSNEIKTVSVKKTTNSTDIILTTKWKVPFNIREYPQSYFTQTAGRPYSIKSFTANYIDIVFYHTTSTDKAPQFNSNVISKTEWISGENTRTLRLHLNKQGGFYGIKYYYNDDNTLTLSIKERNSSAIAGKVIMLDAGHGGNDPGAIGAAVVNGKNVHEATINLALANKIKAKLEALGATVIMTRTSAGQTISLDSRAASCRSKNPDVFIAIHCDASESQSPSGTSAYYYKSYSYPLAYYVGKGIVGAYKNTVYASNNTMASKVDKGAIFKGFRVTRLEECPSVLIEYGYVTNLTECNALIKESNQNALAQGTVDGLVNYFKNS